MSASDFVSEKMDTAVVAENLEITAVYGTQTVTVKVEEESAVFIKEEPITDTELGEYYSCGTNKTEHDILSIALVYTTRLDQMNALNKIERHTSEESTEMILAESRPQYKQLPVSIKTEPSSDSYITSYIKLCGQVEQLNTKVKNETYLRNQKLLKICKPVKIELVDLKTNGTIPPEEKRFDYTEVENYSSDEYVPPSHSSDDEPLTKTMTYTHVTKSVEKVCPTSVTVAIKDKRSQEADIYIFDTNKGIQSYYRTSIDECDIIQKRHLSCRSMLLEYCCWVDREKRINKLTRYGFAKILMNVSAFLRKPHNCFPRPCSCCCVIGNSTNKKSSNDEFIKLTNKQSIAEDVTTFIPITDILKNNDIIEKSKNYMPKVIAVRDTIPPAKTDDVNDYLKRAVIIIKYHRIIFSQNQLLGENYEIGNKGEIVNFLRPTVNRSISEEKQSYELIDTTSQITRMYFCYMICCWHCREDVLIHQLRDLNKLSPSAFRFIRSPHLCRSDKCECCCKPIPLISYKLDNMSTTKTTYAYNKKQVQSEVPIPDVYIRKQLINSSIRTSFDRSSLNENKQTNKDLETRKTINTTDKPKPNQKSTKLISHTKEMTVQNNINLIVDSCFQQKPNKTYSKTKTRNPEFVEIPTNTVNLDNEILANSATDLPTLTKNILDKFKDLKLSVNENGKLTAMINASPGQLSTVDIKIISDILALASKQVEELGITPENFVNRVNSSKVTSESNNRPQNVKINLPLNYGTNIEPKVKAQPLNCFMPTTQNKSPVCNIFQMISSVGGQKNQHLVQAYKLHFTAQRGRVPVMKRKMEVKPAQKRLRVIPLETPKNSQLPALISLKPKSKLDKLSKPVISTEPNQNQLLVTNRILESPNLSSVNISKPVLDAVHHLIQVVNPDQNMLRVEPLEAPKKSHLLTLLKPNSKLEKLRNPVIGTEPNQKPLSVGDSGANTPQPVVIHSQKPIYVIDSSNVGKTQNLSGTNVLEPVTGVVNNQTPVVNNNSYLPVQNANGTIDAAKRVEHNQTPLLFNNGIILLKNTSDTTLLQPAISAINNEVPFLNINNKNIPTKNTGGMTKKADLNQTPYFVQNSHDVTVDSISNLIGLHPEIVSDTNKIPHLVINNNVVPVENTSDLLGLQPKLETDTNEMPLFVNDSKVLPIENSSDPLGLQYDIVIDDINELPPFVNKSNVVNNTSDLLVLQPKLESDINKMPLFLNNSNAEPAQYTIDLTESEMETDNQGPLCDTTFMPSKSNNHATAPNAQFVAKASTGPVPAGNPLLYQMLSQKSPMLLPTALRPTSLQPRATQSSVRPLTLAHSNSKKSPFVQRTRRNIPPQNKPLAIENTQQSENYNPSNTDNEMVVDIIASNSDDDMDNETSLKTNFIVDVPKSAQYSEDEILLAVNNKQLIVEDNDECIFGV